MLKVGVQEGFELMASSVSSSLRVATKRLANFTWPMWLSLRVPSNEHHDIVTSKVFVKNDFSSSVFCFDSKFTLMYQRLMTPQSPPRRYTVTRDDCF